MSTLKRQRRDTVAEVKIMKSRPGMYRIGIDVEISVKFLLQIVTILLTLAATWFGIYRLILYLVAS